MHTGLMTPAVTFVVRCSGCDYSVTIKFEDGGTTEAVWTCPACQRSHGLGAAGRIAWAIGRTDAPDEGTGSS